MWVKTREEVELGIILSNLTHTLLVMNPGENKVVVELSGGDSDTVSAPEAVAQYLPTLTELLKETGTALPVQLVFARNNGDISVKVESAASTLI